MKWKPAPFFTVAGFLPTLQLKRDKSNIVCQLNILVGVQTLVWQNQAKAGRLLFLKHYRFIIAIV